MKNVVLIFTIIVLIISILGCTTEKKPITDSQDLTTRTSSIPQETPTAATTSAPQKTNSTFALQEVPKYGGSGSYSLTVLNPDITECNEEAHTQNNGYFVYVNPYPVDQGGPTYEITDSIIAQEKNLLQNFLVCFYGEGEYEITYDPSISTKVIFENTEIFATADCAGINIGSSLYPFPYNLTTETLHDNPMLSAAITYLEIENPTILQSMEYGFDGTVSRYVYTIFEFSEDPLIAAYNRSFSNIQVNVSAETGYVIVKIMNVAPAETTNAVTLASDAQIDAYLAARFPDAVPEDYIVEVYYDSHVHPGYYVPCYRIYLEEAAISAQLEVPVYTVLSLTNAELLEDTTEE